jgi:hypothetical protein
MKGFNAAVKAGDAKTAAAEAKATWPTFDKASPDTATVAREFGFWSYTAGEYAAARDYALYLKDNAATLSKPDDQPTTTAILFAVSSFRLDANDANRQALLDALKTREAAPGIDNMTVLAAEALYKADAAKAAWARATETAGLAGRLLGRGGEILAPRALEARGLSAASGFLQKQDVGDYDALVDAHDAVVDAIDAATDARKRATLIKLKFQLQAWTNTVARHFDTARRTGTIMPTKVKNRNLKEMKFSPFAAAPDAANYCRGDLDSAAIAYPGSGVFNEMVGTVIMKHDFDADGRVLKSELLGAAPAPFFADAIIKGAPKFRLKRAFGEPKSCQLNQVDYVVIYTFTIGQGD